MGINVDYFIAVNGTGLDWVWLTALSAANEGTEPNDARAKKIATERITDFLIFILIIILLI